MKDYPTPTSVKEMRQFVGIASYYRRFIKGFAKVAQPLHALTQKGAVFKWSVSCQEAFQHLKNLLVEAPVLAYPDFLKPSFHSGDRCKRARTWCSSVATTR